MKQKIDEIIEAGPFNGVVMIYQANAPLYVRAYGFRDAHKKIPLEIDDQFMIGSITKQITAMTALQFIPDLDSTFHELLSHTSGINDSDDEGVKGRFSYSNKGYILVAQKVEELTKKTFDECLKQAYQSAGMFNTDLQPQNTQMTYEELKTLFPRLVKSYDQDKNEQYLTPRSIFRNAAGGLISTARDLIFWNEALYEKQIWGQDKTLLLLTPHINFPHRWGKLSYGYGMQITPKPMLEYSHSGIIRGFLSTLLYYPESKVHVVILENIFWTNPQGNPDFKRHDAIRGVVHDEVLFLKQKDKAK